MLFIFAPTVNGAAFLNSDKTTFDDHIKPIFRTRCANCHNGDKKSGGLDVTNYTNLMQGGNSGRVVQPGDASDSYLFDLVTHNEEPIMPPNSERMPDSEIKLIETWIDGGALENKGSVSNAPRKPKLEMAVAGNAAVRPENVLQVPRIPLDPVEVSRKPTAVNAMAANPWVPLAAVASLKQVLLFDTKTGQLTGILPFPEGQVNVLKFSRNGQLLLAGGGRGGSTGGVVVWDMSTGERMLEVGDELDTVLAADISSDHSLIALGGPKKTVRVYSTSTGQQIYELRKHTQWITSLEFSPDGVLLATGDRNGGAYVWEADNGREYLTLGGHAKSISSISWRIDSNILATSGEDNFIRLWEMENGRQVKNWAAHGGGVSDMQFVLNGNILSSGRDRVPKLWKQDGSAIQSFAPLSDIGVSCCFCNESKRVLASDWRGKIHLHDSNNPKVVQQLEMNPQSLEQRLSQAESVLANLVQSRVAVASKSNIALAKLDGQQKALAAAEAAIVQTTAARQQLSSQVAETKNRVERIKLQIQEWNSTVDKNTKAIPSVQQALESAKIASQKLPEDQELKKAAVSIEGRLNAINKETSRLKKLLLESQQNVEASTKQSQQLETKLAQLNSTDRKSTETISALKKHVQELAAVANEGKEDLQQTDLEIAAARTALEKWKNEIAFSQALRSLKSKLDAAKDELLAGQQIVSKEKAELAKAQQRVDSALSDVGKKKSLVDGIASQIEVMRRKNNN